MRLILCIPPFTVILLLLTILALGQVNAPTATTQPCPSGPEADVRGMNSPSTITIQLAQPPVQSSNAYWEALKAWAPYLAAAIALLGVLAAFYQARLGARYTYASEILKFRLRQIQEFYSPALLLIEQSRIVYDKLRWTISKEYPDFPLEGFRLLDHMFRFRQDPKLKPLIERILETGEKLTKLISEKSGLIEGGLTQIFIDYQAHFAILNSASEQELSPNQKEGWHEFGYYPRMLNREIREGFKLVLSHFENYIRAGDKTIYELLRQKPVELGRYRQQLMENLVFYESHATNYATKFDKFDMSAFRELFVSKIENTREERAANASDDMLKILDCGCGTGRDTYAFLKKGYAVTAIDASPAMLRECRRKIQDARSHPENDQMRQAAQASEKQCLEMTFDEMRFRNDFDGVWAAASLLHVPSQQIENILQKLLQALKPNGILFMSFKYGHGQHEYQARSYTNYDRKGIRVLLKRVPRTVETKLWVSDSSGKDLSPRRQRWAWITSLIGYYDEKLWVNVMTKKGSI